MIGELGIRGVIVAVLNVMVSHLVFGNIRQYVSAFSKITLIPFNSTTEISFSLLDTSYVTL